MTNDAAVAGRAHRRSLWLATTGAVLVAYAALTYLIVAGSPLDRLDLYLYQLNLAPASSPARLPIELYVLVGQGVPASTIAALYAIRRSVTMRSWRPWVMFAWALLLLNGSVGIMKHAIGRLGPKVTDVVHTVWAGGTIFPSGHAANAVVMYGLIAMIAPVAHRKMTAVIAVVLSTTIGLCTVPINTHWISDVFGGWLAGALVLLLVVPLTPPVERLVTRTANRVGPMLVHWWAVAPFRPLTAARLSAAASRRAARADEAPGGLGAGPQGRRPPDPAPDGGSQPSGDAVPDAAALVGDANPDGGTRPDPDDAGPVRQVIPEVVPTRAGSERPDHAHAGGSRATAPVLDAAASIPAHRIDGRPHAARRLTSSGAPTAPGPRSELRDRRQHPLTQGS